jgi:hypothetical protein
LRLSSLSEVRKAVSFTDGSRDGICRIRPPYRQTSDRHVPCIGSEICISVNSSLRKVFANVSRFLILWIRCLNSLVSFEATFALKCNLSDKLISRFLDLLLILKISG